MFLLIVDQLPKSLYAQGNLIQGRARAGRGAVVLVIVATIPRISNVVADSQDSGVGVASNGDHAVVG